MNKTVRTMYLRVLGNDCNTNIYLALDDFEHSCAGLADADKFFNWLYTNPPEIYAHYNDITVFLTKYRVRL